MKKYIKNVLNWLDDRTGFSENIMPVIKHPVPPGAGWWYVFGSGALFCLILQIVTGISLALMYQPSTNAAYQSLQFISKEVPLGNVLRGLHYFGASGMILLMGLHMIRVFIMGAYKFPRELNWLTGVVLFMVTIGMGFTGQILRWDDAGVWSVLIGIEQAGRIPVIGDYVARFLIAGKTLGGQTLSRFYSIHVFLLPAILFGVVGVHLYLVIYNGISEPPEAGRPVEKKFYRQWYEDLLDKKGVPFFPNAAWRDITFSVVVLFVIIALAVFVGPQTLGGPPDPTQIIVVPRPDWYLLWIYAVYALMPPAIESYLIILLPLLVLGFLIALPFWAGAGERSPIKRPWAVAGVLATVTYIIVFWNFGVKAPWSPDFKTDPLPTSIVKAHNPAAKRGVRLFYNKGCQYCHTINGRGGTKGPDLSTVAQRLDTREMKVQIINGGVDMPAYSSSLTDQELNDLIAFLKTRTRKVKENMGVKIKK